MFERQVSIKILTPMFSSGANGREAEFRITELKALMRSTFREFFEYRTVDELKEAEGFLFGNTERKSSVMILNGESKINFINGDFRNMVLHKDYEKYKEKALVENVEIKIRFRSKNEEMLNLWMKILQLAAWTGGLGKRSRKGMGVFQICKIEDAEKKIEFELFKFEKLMEELSKEIKFKIDQKELCYRVRTVKNEVDEVNEYIFSSDKSAIINVNYIKKLTIIKAEFDSNFNNKTNVLYKISELTHQRLITEEFKGKELYNKDILGNCGELLPRFASPVCITVYQFDSKKYLIIKELNYDYIYNEKFKEQSGDKKYIQWYIDEIKKIGLGAK